MSMMGVDKVSLLTLYAPAATGKTVNTLNDNEKEKLTEQIAEKLFGLKPTNLHKLENEGKPVFTNLALQNPNNVKCLSTFIDKANSEHKLQPDVHTNEEAKSAMKYLELVTIYGYYQHKLHDTSKFQGDSDELIESTLNIEEQIRKKLDKPNLERNLIRKDEIEILKNHIQQVFKDNLQSNDRVAFKPDVDKAIEILSGYAK